MGSLGPLSGLQLNSGDISISGMAARLPESDNLQEFYDQLFAGVDLVTEDDRRWSPGIYGLPRRQGRLKSLDKFDAAFFKVPAVQADQMDPQLRLINVKEHKKTLMELSSKEACVGLLHEVTFEAILDAGMNPASIRGTDTGVFIGTSWTELERVEDPEQVKGYTQPGIAKSMLANRLSFTFDLHGPSFTMDSACSSGLLALHQAVSSIRLGYCGAAIVGGVNVCLDPMFCLGFQKIRILSQDGKCKSFDAKADGYARSEACVVLYIQGPRAADVGQASPFRSYATIVHIKSNTDGYKEEGPISPSGHAQKILLQETYEEARIDPRDVQYYEAHGTGTKTGDTTELTAISQVFAEYRTPTHPLLIGTVKSNVGHSEPASGLVAIVKCILAMQTRVIPANLHFESPNPAISSLMDGRLKVVTSNTPWGGGIVGLSSFGFGGANVCLILRSNRKIKNVQEPTDSKLQIMSVTNKAMKIPLIIPMSGRTKEAVQYGLERVIDLIGSPSHSQYK